MVCKLLNALSISSSSSGKLAAGLGMTGVVGDLASGVGVTDDLANGVNGGNLFWAVVLFLHLVFLLFP